MAAKTNDIVPLDLGSLDTIEACNQGAEIELEHPVSKTPIGIFITVLGKESTVFREHIQEQIDSRIRKEALAERRGIPVAPPTSKQQEDSATNLILLCTLGWRQETKDPVTKAVVSKDTITHKGNELEFNIANAKLIYNALPWVRFQVDRAIGDIENFMRDS